MARPNQFDVFLSHNSTDKEMVRKLASVLKERGLKVWLDEWELVPGKPWQEELEEIILETRSTAVLVGEDGLGPWEQPEMRACLVQFVKRQMPVIPVLLPNLSSKPDLPVFLQSFTWVDLRKGFTDEGIERLIWGITGAKPSLLTTSFVLTDEPMPTLISVGNLPPVPEHFVGRKTELGRLDEAWNDPATNIISLVAFGGVGKSALVAEWLQRLSRDHWRGARRVIAYSFYSQGSREDAQVSGEDFIDSSLRLLGDEDPRAGSPWEKGGRLARLIRQSRTLLILDGLEPLQYGPNAGDTGRIKDPGVETLIHELLVANPGLCVLTTRQKLKTLSGAAEIDLDNLLEPDATALLRALGVHGAETALQETCRCVHGHALAIMLLGNYLRKACGGDIRRVDEVELAKADKRQGGHARRLMERYERWLEIKEPSYRRIIRWLRQHIGLGVTWTSGEKMVSILRLMGLFDRPAEADCLRAILSNPAIPGLTDSAVGLTQDEWNWIVADLRDCGLLMKSSLGEFRLTTIGQLDAHPLVREYFAEKLAQHMPNAFREAHRRLYEHLKQSAPDFPSTLQEMMPLYHAMAHGCHAGLHIRVLEDVYRRRICRGEDYFNINVLSAHSSDLAALSHFFDNPWHSVNSAIAARHHTTVLNWVGYRLRTLGRTEEAEELFRRAISEGKKEKNWRAVAVNGVNRSQILFQSGNLVGGILQASEAVAAADLSSDLEIKQRSRATLGQGLHWCGYVEASREAFSEAEALDSAENNEEEPKILRAIPGFRYCDLLVDSGNEARAKERAQVVLRFAEAHSWSLSIGLAHLILASVEFRPKTTFNSNSCLEHLESAVMSLRKSGYVEFLVVALLMRARCYRVIYETDQIEEISGLGETQADSGDEHSNLQYGYLSRAENDLIEAAHIANTSNMLVIQIEAALERARLLLAYAKSTSTPIAGKRIYSKTINTLEDYVILARMELSEAKSLIRETERAYQCYETDLPASQHLRYDDVPRTGDILGYRRSDEAVKALEIILN